MFTEQIIKAGKPKPNKTVTHIRELTQPGETKEMTFERVKKFHNVSNEDLTSGRVTIQIFDSNKMYPNSNTYKKG